jgi:hypothetical protein
MLRRTCLVASAGLLLCSPGVQGASHTLEATKDTVHWGYFSKTLKPQLTIASGDTVTVEMVSHHAGDNPDLMIKGDKNLEEIFAWAPKGPGTTHEVPKHVPLRGACLMLILDRPASWCARAACDADPNLRVCKSYRLQCAA